ncbi:hypothetical protein RHGRI_011209 [Rhododendron griersonianum]|uniref:RING-type domain-containing protein n=1 Tax=Rhododendron griersonianum TaxID=479676 RepID=A0AAV6KKY7_9ERIC|nr:hypothetical protein RHGRI_011209 [Rhododendron griersonianum]
MDNSKADSNGAKTTADENPNNSGFGEQQEGLNMVRPSSTIRTPFTNLSQVDADLALARTLQEQERAYMMLRMGGDGSEYGSWEGGRYIHEDDEDFDDPSGDEYDRTDDSVDDGDNDDGDDEDEDDGDDEDEDAFDVHAHAESGEDNNMSVGVELDPAFYPNDEAYARALQDAEDREMAARLLALAGINEREDEEEDHAGNSQDAWEEVDPDELSYEELIALGEVVGTESRGLSGDTIASLPSLNYKTQNTQDGSNDSCVICRLDYEDGDTLTLLSCKHSYHSECINNWLRINKDNVYGWMMTVAVDVVVMGFRVTSVQFAAPRSPLPETANAELDGPLLQVADFLLKMGFRRRSCVRRLVYRSSSVEWKPSPVLALATIVDDSQVVAARAVVGVVLSEGEDLSLLDVVDLGR